jgi:hypothetical protein
VTRPASEPGFFVWANVKTIKRSPQSIDCGMATGYVTFLLKLAQQYAYTLSSVIGPRCCDNLGHVNVELFIVHPLFL